MHSTVDVLRSLRTSIILTILIVSVGCEKAPTFGATGTIASGPEEMPDLGGKGIWIRHDGLTYEVEGKKVAVDGMRAPFKIGGGLKLGELNVNDRISFRFKPRPNYRGFPFEVTEMKILR